jgi:biotin transport system substrate-specific component
VWRATSGCSDRGFTAIQKLDPYASAPQTLLLTPLKMSTRNLNLEGVPVSKELSAPLDPTSNPTSVPSARLSIWLHSARIIPAAIILAGSLLVAVCAHLAVPLIFTPVPLSLAPFAVLVIGLLVRPRLAAATLVAYLAEGALGLPVFAPTPLAPGGLAHLFGPTGGYLLSYPLAAALIAFLVRRTNRGFAPAALSAAAGSLVILFCGAVWLAALTHASVQSVLTLAVLPFLPGDALKVVAAAALAATWVRLRSRSA